MSFHLTVTHSFDGHRVGEKITDPTLVATILAGKSKNKVVKIIPRSVHAPVAPVEPAEPAEDDAEA